MSHIYSDTFFDYIDTGARRSAEAITGLLGGWLRPGSVVDLGCGRGVWLDVWQQRGVRRVLGIDGDYVNRAALAIPPEDFQPADLTEPLHFRRRFDLAQSLEVGEHLPTRASDTLVQSLCNASDRVLFSAAVVGQGGECHINEQPLAFWQEKFAARGYTAYDCLRPYVRQNTAIAPWYRYNSVLYVNEAGAQGLPEGLRACRLGEGEVLREIGDLRWRLRRGVVSKLPRGAVTRLAQWRAGYLARRASAA